MYLIYSFVTNSFYSRLEWNYTSVLITVHSKKSSFENNKTIVLGRSNILFFFFTLTISRREFSVVGLDNWGGGECDTVKKRCTYKHGHTVWENVPSGLKREKKLLSVALCLIRSSFRSWDLAGEGWKGKLVPRCTGTGGAQWPVCVGRPRDRSNSGIMG